MGFLRGFVGGAAGATADLALISMKDKSEREMAEANALRERALAEYNNQRADARLDTEYKYRGKESADDRAWKTGENELDRTSAEKVASLRKSTSGRPITKEITDPDTGEKTFVQWDADSESWLPANIGGAGAAPRISLEQATQMARKEAEDKAKYLNSDQEDFADAGGSREKWINTRAMQIMNGGESVDQGKPAPAIPSAKAPSYDEYVANVRKTNKGIDIPDEELRSAYAKRFGDSKVKVPGIIAGELKKDEEGVKNKSGLSDAITAAKSARTEFDRQYSVWSKWQHTRNPEQTKANAKQWISDNMSSLTPAQRKKAESILSSFGADK